MMQRQAKQEKDDSDIELGAKDNFAFSDYDNEQKYLAVDTDPEGVN